MEEKTFKEKILEEMTVDYASTLEKNFETAKQFLKITDRGKVSVQVKDRVPGPTKILLYLIGKIYAKEANLCESEYVENEELLKELEIPMGSLLPWIKKLRESHLIFSVSGKKGKALHAIKTERIGPILGGVKEKLSK